MNEYDDIVSELFGPAPKPPAGPYDAIAKEQAAGIRDSASASLTSAVKSDPDTFAKALRLERTTGVPAQVAERNMPEVEAKQKLNEYDVLLSTSPVLARKMADPNFARLTHDDGGIMANLESGLKAFIDGGSMKRYVPDVIAGLKNTGVAAASSIPSIGAKIFDAEALVFDLLSKATSWVLPYDFAGAISASARSNALRARESLGQVGYQGTNTTARAALGGVTSGFESLALLPIGVEYGASAFAATMATLAGAQANTEAREKGLDTIGALTYAIPDAAFEYLFEIAPASQLLGDISRHTNLREMMFNFTKKEVVGEELTTLSENFNEWLRLNPEKTIKQFLAEVPGEAYHTLIGTLVGSAVQTGTIRAMQGVQNDAQEQAARAADAENKMLQLKSIFDMATATKLKVRDASTLSAFIQDVADSKDSTPSSLFVDARTLDEALQQAGVSMDQFAQLVPAVKDQVQSAIATGGTIELPIGDLTANVAGTDLESVLLPNLRVRPDALSQVEAKLASEQAAKELSSRATEAIAAAEDQDAFARSSEAVRENLSAQLAAANRFTKSVNDVYASTVADFYTVYAQRLGTTPEALFQRSPYTIVSQSAPSRGDTLDQQGEPSADAIEGFSVLVKAEPPVRSVADQQTLELVHPAGKNDTTIRAEVNGKEIGYLDLAVREDGKTADVRDIKVSKDYQRKGVATALVKEAIAKGYDVQRSPYMTSDGAALDASFPQPAKNALQKRVDDALDQDAAPLVRPNKYAEKFLAGRDVDSLSKEEREQYDALVSEPEGTAGTVVNIGLNVNDGSTITKADVEAALDAIDVQIISSTEQQSNTEPTLVARLSRALTADEATTISEQLRQDAIAQYSDGKGDLFGPKADAWGPFNPEFFIGMDGKTLATPPEALPGKAIHFSREARANVDGRYYGRGMKGLEGERVLDAQDKRLKDRVYFYLDTGNGVQPEDGVGGVAHELTVPDRLYDAQANPNGLWKGGSPEALNDTETRLLDAGYNGYFVRDIGNGQGAGVIIGPASRGVAAQRIENPVSTYTPPVVEQPYKRGLMSAEMKLLDMPAIQAAAPSAKLRSGIFQVDNAEFVAAQAAAAQQGVDLPAADTLSQATPKRPPRGSFKPSALRTTLLETADLTTFLHETGHLFLTITADLASDPSTPEAVRADMGVVLDWFGVPDLETWNKMTLDQQRPYHEQFARGFEAYLFEGKSPSLALHSTFQRFRSWLVRVYQSITALDVTLTDEVRGVFDRMLATDQQIAEAEQARVYAPLFTDAAAIGMTVEEWGAYQQKGADTTALAEEELQTRSLRDMQWLTNARARAMRALRVEAREAQRLVQEEVTAEVRQLPVYAVQHWIKGKGLPDGSPAEGAKLSMQMLKDFYGEDPAAPWRYLATNLVSTSPELSMPPDDIADMFGFPSGDAMVREIIAADPEAVRIEALTDQRMLQRYGDIATPEAMSRAADEAVHNEARLHFIATELIALQKATNVREKTAAGGTVNVMVRAAREYASAIIARKVLSDVKPHVFAAAEARAARQAEEAMKKGDLVAATTAKRNQVLNNALTREAYAVQAEMEKNKAFLRRVVTSKDDNVGKTRDLDVVNAARAVIAQYGIGAARGKTALEYMDVLAHNDPVLYSALKPSIDIALANAKPFTKLTVEEARGLVEDIDGMWHMAQRTREMIVGGELVSRKVAEDALLERMQEIGIPDTMPGDASAVTPMEKRIATLRTVVAAGVRVEAWAGAKDGDAAIGPFRKYVWQVVKEPANAYRADKVKYLKEYRALLQAVTPSLKHELIASPELNYTFGKGKGGIGMSELLHAIIHTGNESNKRKLLLGRKWATQDAEGNMDTSKWDSFIERMITEGKLTKAHYDFAQGVWDMLDSMKPLAQRAHRDVFGKYFAEVTAQPFDTPFGQYRGGYAPAIADPDIVPDAAIRALAEAENESMAFAFPFTNKGFTKQRVEYNRPLKLDLRSIGQHIDKVLLFSHMEQPVRDVRKLLSSKGVSYALSRVDPAALGSIITPWLNRSARQQVETPIVGDGGAARWFGVMRNNAGMAAMFANVSNSVQQVTGGMLSLIKVDAKYLLHGMAEWTRSPRETNETVAAASSYMANRMRNEIGAMNSAIDDILLDPNMYEKTKAWTARHAYFMQAAVDNVVGPIIWIGAHSQALEQGMSEADAVRLADSAVRETQGSTLPEDVSRIETGNAYVRLFTQFMGYFNMWANLLGGEFVKIQHAGGLRQGAGRAVFVVTMGFMAPAILAEAVTQIFRGGPGDDDGDGEWLDDWLWQVFGMGPIRTAAAMVPVIGPLSMGVLNAANSKPYDDRLATSPAISMIESAVRAPVTVYKAIVDDGKKQKAVKDVATMLSMATGIPATAVARPLGYLVGVQAGEIEPTGPVDAARGLATGSVSPDSKR